MKKCLNPEDEVYADVESIEKGSKQARDLVRQYNTFAKAEASDKKTTSITKLINDTCGQTISDTKIKCDFSIPDDLWPVEVNSQQMSQVINNMVTNACESMPEGGHSTCWS